MLCECVTTTQHTSTTRPALRGSGASTQQPLSLPSAVVGSDKDNKNDNLDVEIVVESRPIFVYGIIIVVVIINVVCINVIAVCISNFKSNWLKNLNLSMLNAYRIEYL